MIRLDLLLGASSETISGMTSATPNSVTADSPQRPIFLYDGDCMFCSSCARFIERRVHTSAEVKPWQFSDLTVLGVTQEQCEEAVQWIDADGRVESGSRGVGRLLIDARSYWRPLGWLLLVPPLSLIAPPLYRIIARNRHRLPGGTAACALPQATRDALREDKSSQAQ